MTNKEVTYDKSKVEALDSTFDASKSTSYSDKNLEAGTLYLARQDATQTRITQVAANG